MQKDHYNLRYFEQLLEAFSAQFPTHRNESGQPDHINESRVVLTRDDGHLIEQHLTGHATSLPLLRDSDPLDTHSVFYGILSLYTHGYTPWKREVLLADFRRLINAAKAIDIPAYQARSATGLHLFVFTDASLRPNEMAESLAGWLYRANLTNPEGVDIQPQAGTSMVLPYAGAADCPAGLGASPLHTPEGIPIPLSDVNSIKRASRNQLLIQWRDPWILGNDDSYTDN